MVLAGSRKFDVYVGVDVYGRNCYQDGGFNVDKVESNTAGSLRKDRLLKKIIFKELLRVKTIFDVVLKTI